MSKRLLFLIFINFFQLSHAQHRLVHHISRSQHLLTHHKKKFMSLKSRSIKHFKKLPNIKHLFSSRTKRHNIDPKKEPHDADTKIDYIYPFLPSDLIIPIVLSADSLKSAAKLTRLFMSVNKKAFSLLTDQYHFKNLRNSLSEKFKTSDEETTNILATQFAKKLYGNQFVFRTTVCAKNAKIEDITRLLKKEKTIDFDYTFNTKRGPQNILTLLMRIGRKKSINIIELLINKGAFGDMDQFFNINGYTQLHYLPTLLKLNVLDINKIDSNTGNTILVSVLKHLTLKNHPDKHRDEIYSVIKLLLQNGADPNKQNKEKEYPLSYAQLCEDIRFEQLIQNAIDKKN